MFEVNIVRWRCVSDFNVANSGAIRLAVEATLAPERSAVHQLVRTDAIESIARKVRPRYKEVMGKKPSSSAGEVFGGRKSWNCERD